MSSAQDSRPAAHPVGALFERSVMDPLVEVARAVADDYVARPRHYRSVPENVASILADLRARTGADPNWPSLAQRGQVFTAVFDNAFHVGAAELRASARAFVQRSAEATLDPLEDRVRTAARAFGGHLKALGGRSLESADLQTGHIFAATAAVLRSPEVAAAFGVAPAPGGDWPLDWSPEADPAGASDGALLVETIQRSLAVFRGGDAVTEQLFLLLQRVAHFGAATITAAVEGSGDRSDHEWIAGLVGTAYGWDEALRASLDAGGDRPQPRVVSRLPLDDEHLRSLPTEEEARRSGMAMAEVGGGGPTTCLTGWTIVCDTGPSCTYGLTLRCDTGPTCTSGWTIVCDSGPTCTYGWTLKCDKPRAW